MSSPENQPRVQSIIKHDRVRKAEDFVEAASALPARAGVRGDGAGRCKKSVQILRENDVVHALEVRCSCGEVTVVEIEYGPTPA